MKRDDANSSRRVRAHILKRGMKPQDGDGNVWAYVNHGRWVADCPCGGAELIREGQPLLCGSCAHKREVVWPPDIEDIEAVLEQRKDRSTQNWQPNETVASLATENERNR